MDTNEVATKSRQSQTLKERIENFRKERIDAIHKRQTPTDLPSSHKLVLHLIPEQAFCGFEIGQQDLTFLQWMPILHFTGGWSQEHNLEGMVAFDRAQGLPSSWYVQPYRNGIVESVADDVTFYHPNDTAKRHRLFKTGYLREIPSRLKNYFELLEKIGVNPPVWFFMSFVGLNGVEIASRDYLRSTGRPIRETQLLAPGKEIDKRFARPVGHCGGWGRLSVLPRTNRTSP